MKNLPYKEAIKLPKGGAIEMNADNLQASAAGIIAQKHCFNPAAVYEWANKHGINLRKYGYILSNIKCNSILMSDILNDTSEKIKKLLK